MDKWDISHSGSLFVITKNYDKADTPKFKQDIRFSVSLKHDIFRFPNSRSLLSLSVPALTPPSVWTRCRRNAWLNIAYRFFATSNLASR